MALFQTGKRRDAGFGIAAVQNQLSLFNGVYLYFMKVNSGKGKKNTPQEEGKPGRGHCFALIQISYLPGSSCTTWR